MNELKLISGTSLTLFGLISLIGFVFKEDLVLYGDNTAIVISVLMVLIGVVLLTKSKI